MADRHLLRLAAITAVVAVAATLVLNHFALTVVRVVSDSMAPTIRTGESVLVNRLGDIHRGDIVAVDGVDTLVNADHPPIVFVKRVVAVGGDQVSCCTTGGLIEVNGEVQQEPYVVPEARDDLSFDVHVPANSLWLMGDNRVASADSRSRLGSPGGGFVPEHKVIGKAVAVVAPISQARSVASP